MNKQELTNTTEKLLNGISELRESIQNRIPGEKPAINTLKLKHLVGAIKTLPEDNQKMIIYKYFEDKKDVEIARILKVDTKTINRRLDKLVLEIGRIIFGMEDEFFSEIGIREHEEYKTDHQVLREILG